MSRKRNHRMRPELRARQQRGQTLFIHPKDLSALSQPHMPADVDRLMAKTNTALVRLLDGSAERVHISRLGADIDLAAIRLDQLAKQIENAGELRAALERAGAAIREAVRIHEQHGRFGLTGPGRHDLQAGVDAYEALLRVSSPREMHDAEEALSQALNTEETTT